MFQYTTQKVKCKPVQLHVLISNLIVAAFERFLCR